MAMRNKNMKFDNGCISTITPQVLLETWISVGLNARKGLLDPIHWDCQDTECNNETECYFYFPNTLTEEEVKENAKMICDMLEIDDKCYRVENQTEDGNPEIRIDVVCSISVRSFGGCWKMLVPSEDESEWVEED